MRRSLIFLSLFLSTFIGIGQDCDCNISQVANNTVTPCDLVVGEIVNVSTTNEFMNAVNQANTSGGNMTILIEDGTYAIASTTWYPYITANDVVFRSASGNRDAVILTGQGMQDVNPGTEACFFAVGNNITIADLTIREVGNHGIMLNGENLYVHNVRIQDTYEQMIKGVSSEDGGDNGKVQCSLFEYTAGIGPQFYIGGLDIHDGDDWVVRDNIFKNIASPSGSLAEHAVHFWNSSSNNIIERNMMYNCDRGIGFGLGGSPSEGGIIRNNMIYNDGGHPYHDVGIGLETSPNTKVYNNTVMVEYQNAIEYRFEATTDVLIANNLTNKPITSRDGGQATLTTNYEDALDAWMVDVSNGDLRLDELVDEAVNMGTDLGDDVTDDVDQTERPLNFNYDIGAHEFFLDVSNEDFSAAEDLVKIFPNPVTTFLEIKSLSSKILSYKIYDTQLRVYSAKNIQGEANKVVFPVTNLQAGYYVIFVQLQNGQEEYKSFVVAP